MKPAFRLVLRAIFIFSITSLASFSKVLADDSSEMRRACASIAQSGDCAASSSPLATVLSAQQSICQKSYQDYRCGEIDAKYKQWRVDCSPSGICDELNSQESFVARLVSGCGSGVADWARGAWSAIEGVASAVASAAYRVTLCPMPECGRTAIEQAEHDRAAAMQMALQYADENDWCAAHGGCVAPQLTCQDISSGCSTDRLSSCTPALAESFALDPRHPPRGPSSNQQPSDVGIATSSFAAAQLQRRWAQCYSIAEDYHRNTQPGLTQMVSQVVTEMIRQKKQEWACLKSAYQGVVACNVLIDAGLIAAGGAAAIAKIAKYMKEGREAKAIASQLLSESAKTSRAGAAESGTGVFKSLKSADEVAQALRQSANGKKLADSLGPARWAKLMKGLADGNVEGMRIFATVLNTLKGPQLQEFIERIGKVIPGESNLGSLSDATLNEEARDLVQAAYSRQLAASRAPSVVAATTDTPESPAALRRTTEINQWSDLPQASTGELSDVKEIPRGRGGRAGAVGTGFLRLERAQLNGQSVFVKISSASEEGVAGQAARMPADVLNEARMMKALNQIGLGPKLRGVTTRIVDGRSHYAIVSDFVEGQEFSSDASQGLRVTQSMIDDVRATGAKLDRSGIATNDLQFRFTPDGHAVVIDPEYFSMGTPGATGSVQEAEQIAQRLEIRMLMQSQGH